MMQTLRKPGRKPRTHFGLGISSLRPPVTRYSHCLDCGVGASHAQAQKTH